MVLHRVNHHFRTPPLPCLANAIALPYFLAKFTPTCYFLCRCFKEMNLFITLKTRLLCTARPWICVIALSALFTTSVHAFPQKLRAGRGQEAAARLVPINRLPAPPRLTLAVSLPLRNEAELDGFIRGLYDPTSPAFRQYLTPEQFADKFGPSREDYQGLLDFAKAN